MISVRLEFPDDLEDNAQDMFIPVIPEIGSKIRLKSFGRIVVYQVADVAYKELQYKTLTPILILERI